MCTENISTCVLSKETKKLYYNVLTATDSDVFRTPVSQSRNHRSAAAVLKSGKFTDGSFTCFEETDGRCILELSTKN